MSDHIFDEDKLEVLARTPRRLHASVSAESYGPSSESVATNVHFVVKNRPFCVRIESVGNAENYSEKNLRWVAALVRFEPESYTHDQATSRLEDSESSDDEDRDIHTLKSLHPVVHEHAKPTLKTKENGYRSQNLATIEVKLQLLSSKVGHGFRLFVYATKSDGSLCPGYWALTEPLKVVSKPEQAHKHDYVDEEKKVKASPFENIVQATSETRQEVQQMKFMLANVQAMLATQMQSSEIAQKKRSRESMESDHKEPVSLDEAFANFMAAMESFDPTMQATAPKLRKLFDGYLSRTASPTAVPAIKCVAEVAMDVASVFAVDAHSDEQTEDEEMFASTVPSAFQSACAPPEISDMLRMSAEMKNSGAYGASFDLLI